MPEFEPMKKGYGHLWDECALTKPSEAAAVADRILANKDLYLNIEAEMGVPWIAVGAWHMREANLNMRAHLHNGDSLLSYTKHVPAGRPKIGHGPPFRWEESAIDALKLKGLEKLKGTWYVELLLFETERYNGFGYLTKGNSPYVWSWTNEYHGGKYVADHVYDPNHWDEQPGCAAIYKALAAKDESAKAWLSKRKGGVPEGATKRATQTERKAAGAGAATSTVATGSEVATTKPAHPTDKVAYHMMHGTVIIIGAVVMVVALTIAAIKAKQVRERFLGAM